MSPLALVNVVYGPSKATTIGGHFFGHLGPEIRPYRTGPKLPYAVHHFRTFIYDFCRTSFL